MIRAAAAQLPRQPAKVRLLTPDNVPDQVRAKVRALDAFTLEAGDGTIYLNTDSALFKAARTDPFYRSVLAVVLWHEMAHLEGADEREAQRREQELWTLFIRDERVSTDSGLRYQAVMAKRQHAAPAAR